MKLVQRTQLLEKIKSTKGTSDIKIITGVRRAGKSKLLSAYMDFLQENEVNCNIIFIDLRLLEFEHLQEYHALNEYICSHYVPNVNNYLIIDEVQMCEKFELCINSLHATEQYDIYLTGSNAFLLSSDLATLFTGRYIEISVLPFSFNEYRTYFGEQEKHAQLDEYLVNGGLSGSYVYKDEELRKEYIKDVYNTILQRDLVEKYNLADSDVLPRLMEYMMDNISNISSPNSIAGALTATNIPSNNHTISKYLDYLTKAYILYKVNRYDIRGKKYLQSQGKYYLVDSGIRYAILGTRNIDYGRIYENIVFLELIRRGYEVYVGKLYQKEIDFVALKGTEKIYIQVSDNIANEETFKREYTPLLQIKDAYPKYIIANTRHPEYNYEGILVRDIADWLTLK
ncbi:MAG: ATP-binding protein [Paludibacteraceae bacterium]|nr:ATP-binding protein [Paludibacteraceae bacterium]